MINLGSILKSKDITLPIKVHLVKATVFPVVMYEPSNTHWTLNEQPINKRRGMRLQPSVGLRGISVDFSRGEFEIHCINL